MSVGEFPAELLTNLYIKNCNRTLQNCMPCLQDYHDTYVSYGLCSAVDTEIHFQRVIKQKKSRSQVQLKSTCFWDQVYLWRIKCQNQVRLMYLQDLELQQQWALCLKFDPSCRFNRVVRNIKFFRENFQYNNCSNLLQKEESKIQQST